MVDQTLWDVVVVGGGPAGMMAAGRAAEQGAKVVLLEKNNSLGKKLLITGGGRCNVTNAELDNRKLLAKFKTSEQFLFSAFSQWSVKNTLNFFNTRGMETKVENELRVFPASNSAQSVWNVLVAYLNQNGVTVKSNCEVIEIIKSDNKLIGVKLKNKKVITGKNIIIATGGTSRPETGSTGDGYNWLANLGHTVTPPRPSLVPVAIKEQWIKRLAGVSLNNIKLTLYQNEVKQNTVKGKILFTHLGVSGPTVLNISKDIGELLKYGKVVLALDLLPADDYSTLNTKLQALFKTHDKKQFKNVLSILIPSAMTPIIIELSGIDPNIKCNSLKREARLKLVKLLKSVPMPVSKLLGVDKAIITAGGVSLDEIDFKTMSSRLYPNLYLIGDILNIDRPSGGYSLQLCWTTGFVAGNSVKK
ncbi:MAG: NAD(P)/FAD-dependent oxidoreductase [bacterium]|nr:NAD(P)/FAD-dependent oxidoreductase [bacterium]